MISIKEALTFDDVTLKPKYSNVLPLIWYLPSSAFICFFAIIN